MRVSGVTSLGIAISLGVACDNGVSPTPAEAGGNATLGVGGSTAPGSSMAQGGTVAQSSTTATQQSTAQGGSPTGGADSSGGVESTGGRTTSSTKASGGVATGGQVNSGGTQTSNTGGVQTGGTRTATGGNATVPTGGKAATGGAQPLTGGASTGPACVDTPRSTESCADAKAWGFCTQSWFTGYCQATCGTCGSNPGAGGTQGQGGMQATGGAASPTGGYGNNSTLPDVTGGQNAWASRYWDCCKPACGWTGNTGDPISSCDKSNNNIGVNDSARNACEGGGTAYMCWAGVPHAVSNSVAYGFAAASGSNYKCGQCYQIQFDGNSHNGGPNAGTQAIRGKQMIIQVINNGGVAADQFDLLIPGGGVGDFDACTSQWGASDLGARYGGFLAGCNGDKTCVQNKCNTVFAGKPDLLAGCDWFLNWFQGADNPTFQYKPVNCPSDFNSVMGGLNK